MALDQRTHGRESNPQAMQRPRKSPFAKADAGMELPSYLGTGPLVDNDFTRSPAERLVLIVLDARRALIGLALGNNRVLPRMDRTHLATPSRGLDRSLASQPPMPVSFPLERSKPSYGKGRGAMGGGDGGYRTRSPAPRRHHESEGKLRAPQERTL
ncbi:uncharacterized protein N7482_006767 [Penicillium canariense]|uniref:Uncharacterized protein n=1 Tax=Penicillium canariense TaxID=189055 RepID=A0A9W9HXR7_9EURO|nr:uncharacterized protein N7482_006767 [Penicillium canariense]KAJ5159763.1 hypothetical protein N7482_006767 [Penicillium canariense]